MKCISSPALDDTQILSYVEGEADDAVVTHMQECPFCSERAQQWTGLQKRLQKQFYRVSCPTPMELGDYYLGYLPDSQELVIAQHLRECALCRQEVAILEDFLSRPIPETSLLGAARVLIARLVGGPAQNGAAPAVPALRGVSKGPLTFEADSVLILLDIQPASGGKVNILGQVAADDQDQWTGALVELRREEQLQSSMEIDDLGAFHFEGVMTGEQELRIISQDKTIIVISVVENST